MQKKPLGKNGPLVSRLALGSHSNTHSPESDAELIATLHTVSN